LKVRRICVFGSLRLFDEAGTELDIPLQLMHQILLARLVCADGPVPRVDLGVTLWGDRYLDEFAKEKGLIRKVGTVRKSLQLDRHLVTGMRQKGVQLQVGKGLETDWHALTQAVATENIEATIASLMEIRGPVLADYDDERLGYCRDEQLERIKRGVGFLTTLDAENDQVIAWAKKICTGDLSPLKAMNLDPALLGDDNQQLPVRPIATPSVDSEALNPPDMALIAVCERGRRLDERVEFVFDEEVGPERPEPAESPLIAKYILPHLKAQAAKRRIRFKDDPTVDLVADQETEKQVGRRLLITHHLRAAPSTYYEWAATANSLDLPLSTISGAAAAFEAPTLRDLWSVEPPDELEDLAELPAPAMIGLCVVPVDGHEFLMFPRKRHFVASAWADASIDTRLPVHVLGEGMSPKDLDDGRLSLEIAAGRAIDEEILFDPEDFELIPTAVVIDRKRWQPVFCYVACYRGEGSLVDLVRGGKHSWETRGGAAWNLSTRDNDTRLLLEGRHGEARLASNHAHAAVLYALYWNEGHVAVTTTLGNR
jgi:hypothetical protein